MNDPFHIEGPAVLNISGGRTSGYMLHRILQAHGGQLPMDVVAIFCNTGKEMPQTLDFLEAMRTRWRVPMTWLEYRTGKRWAVVNHATASRNGEPFEALITDRNFLPNPVARICTVELKVLTTERYAVEELGFDFYTSVVGIRADEPARMAKIGQSGRKAFDREAPLGRAGVKVAEVGAFWDAHPFDLTLPTVNGKAMHGNCDLCFLKGANQVLSLIREKPERAVWWMTQESRIRSEGQIVGDAGKFRSDRPSYAEMHRMATNHGEMFPFEDGGIQDCVCVD